jgi:hypothetical protein
MTKSDQVTEGERKLTISLGNSEAEMVQFLSWMIRRRRAYCGRVAESRIGPKVTEIGMIFRLHDLLGNFGEADFPGTQFDELLNGLLFFHYCLSSGRHW